MPLGSGQGAVKRVKQVSEQKDRLFYAAIICLPNGAGWAERDDEKCKYKILGPTKAIDEERRIVPGGVDSVLKRS